MLDSLDGLPAGDQIEIAIAVLLKCVADYAGDNRKVGQRTINQIARILPYNYEELMAMLDYAGPKPR
jgi:hypothetical protein